ncbi:unnamed protein product [Polarella glacialis]|uniref:Uncharacterized protein n=1 Tax=Polarella glacialis TaxID=89957 RepID=A0A813LEI4_POLGL|nr:unnamed protein product [Polarella glacialis]
MDACARAGRWQLVLALLSGELSPTGHPILVDGVSFSTAISACEREGKWESCLMLLADMRSQSFAADLTACQSATWACGHGRRWQEALAILSMQADFLGDNGAASPEEGGGLFALWSAAVWALAHQRSCFVS